MFSGLRNEIVKLNGDVNNVANSEKAKKLRKKLLTIGITLTVLGFGGVITCFTLFVVNGVSNFNSSSFGPGPGIIIPFILFVPCGLIGGIGTMITHMGFSIVITGYTANLIEETVTLKCPDCGDPISEKELFCTKCGRKLKNKCPKCGYINELDDKYCCKCGSEL